MQQLQYMRAMAKMVGKRGLAMVASSGANFASSTRAPVSPISSFSTNSPVNSFFTTRRSMSSSKGLSRAQPVSNGGDDDEPEVEALPDALATEIAEEAAEDAVDPELEDITKVIKKTFTIKDASGNGTVHLHGTIGGTQVHVTFDCQDEAETGGMDMNEFEMPPEQGEDEEATLGFGINFTARLTSSTGDKMVIDAVASEDLQVLNVQHVPAGKDEEDGELYGGPVFDQLSESLQDSMYAYLEDHKIDEDLCFFILAHCRAKEQREYVNWLNGLLAMTDKKK